MSSSSEPMDIEKKKDEGTPNKKILSKDEARDLIHK